MTDPKRVQFDLAAANVAALDALSKQLGLTSRKDTVNTGLSLLAWAAKQVASGRIITSMHPSSTSYRELTMPCLDHARSLGPQ